MKKQSEFTQLSSNHAGSTERISGSGSRLSPGSLQCLPGREVGSELVFPLSAGFVLLLGSVIPYGARLSRGIDALYRWQGKEKILIAGAKLPPLSALCSHIFLGFWPFLLLLLWQGYTLYRECAADRTIYVYRRLSDPYELHREVWSVPVFCLIAGMIFSLILLGLYILAYYLAAPAGTIPAHAAAGLWRCLV